ncbi:unnamed protein product [Acanthoscelides obtectus]|uniref:BZIP domain-containing protein n=1 Tax=Acanthoscelides obtectus TaxID=200917 RepID=A0A9P0JK29_ACAOB|nr:unnamed protein product [Acanthoscelides obtectus]CAK1678607.1 Cyclic AMP response element-binding protein A [Acanthoscelides obtectus]
MEDECFPAISMNTACTKLQHDELTNEEIDIKDEPNSETDSTQSSCPSSPHSIYVNASDLPLDVEMTSSPSPTPSSAATTTIASCNSTPTLPTTTILLTTSPHTVIPPRFHRRQPISANTVKIEPAPSVGLLSAFHHLPPTPPSCSSDSEGGDGHSRPQSPAQQAILVGTTQRRVGGRGAVQSQGVGRQPICTPLISSQPKGSTGTLILTEEEKRTLLAEGYPVPTRLPLTKAEEKSLKKIRRKIKNKISAQESRRKKKEYMDQLERKVEHLVSENNEYRQKIENLEDSNTNLLTQLQKLQAIVARTHPQIIKQLKLAN